MERMGKFVLPKGSPLTPFFNCELYDLIYPGLVPAGTESVKIPVQEE